ncbi:MAG: sigma-70 region 4 domain-containing protein [Dehalococcoidia bacterium]|nr:sigma-70 region 4 domain-containing protein [Dehalococcoidia bacterium]
MKAKELIVRRREAVRQHHVEKLSLRRQQVLLLEFFGLEIGEIACLLGMSPQTVKNHAHLARSIVVPPDLPATRATATLWVGLHSSCCMATTFAMLQI